MKIELKRIGVFSGVKTLFVLGGVGGFLIGVLIVLTFAVLTARRDNLDDD